MLLLHPHDDVIQWKHLPRYWPSVRGSHRWPVVSPHKGQWRGALMFSLVCAWTNGWVNNRDTGDLRYYRAHYDVTVTVMRQPKCHAVVAKKIDCHFWKYDLWILQSYDNCVKSISTSNVLRMDIIDGNWISVKVMAWCPQENNPSHYLNSSWRRY